MKNIFAFVFTIVKVSEIGQSEKATYHTIQTNDILEKSKPWQGFLSCPKLWSGVGRGGYIGRAHRGFFFLAQRIFRAAKHMTLW